MVLAKAKENPLTELPLRKGVFCALRTARASPFGRGVCEADGEGKPVSREPPRSDKQALCQSDAIAESFCLFSASLPSQALTRQLSQGESL